MYKHTAAAVAAATIALDYLLCIGFTHGLVYLSPVTGNATGILAW
jgi:hypothetical protein